MKQKFNNFIALFRRHYVITLSFMLMVAVFGLPAQAGVMEGIMSVLAGIFGLLSMVVGSLLSFLLEILVNVAQFNDFIYVTPVVYGWVVVRDICNMFFIVVLLIIAFATILQLNGYDWKKDVPKLVMAAILINFSKMFAGLAIDVSQVMMLTFVNAFAANGANNLALAFQISKFNSFSDALTKTDSGFQFSLLLASVAGFAAACIATVIVVVMMIALVMRIVMLWIYVILSPLPYLMGTFQKGKQYADKWWAEFTKELIAGPVLAFFLWLALTVAKMPDSELIKSGTTTKALSGADGATTGIFLSGGTQLFTNGPFQKYLIVIGLMVGGLKIAGEAGGTMGQWAKKGSAWVNNGANLSKKMSLGGLDTLNRKIAGGWGKDGKFGTGIDLNVGRQIDRIKRGFGESKKRDLEKGNKAAFRNLQMGGLAGGVLGFTADDWYDNYFGFDGMKKVMKGKLFGEGNRLSYAAEQSSKNEAAKEIEQQIAGLPMGTAEWAKKRDEKENELSEIDAKITHGNYNGRYNEKTEALTKLRAELNADVKEKSALEKNKDSLSQSELDHLDELSAKITDKEKDIDKISQERIEVRNQEKQDRGNKTRIEEELQALREYGMSGELVNQEDLDKRREELTIKADKLKLEATKAGANASFLKTSDQYYEASLRSSQAEGLKRVGTTDNEDEGLMALERAEARGDTMGMAAIVKQMAKIGGMNAVLDKYGYNASAGMSLLELKKITAQLKEKHGNDQAAINAELQQHRGFNDFMRDVFGKKMGNKAMLALQSDISSVAEGGSHQYMAKTVTINPNTKELDQASGSERAAVIVGERRKQENEGNIRKFGRFGYGDELAGGKFKWNEEGMTTFIDNLALVAKEIKGTRFNRNAATKIVGGEGTLDELARALRAIEKQGLLAKSEFYTSADDFIKKLTNYAKGSAGEDAKKVSSIVHGNISNPYN